MKFLDAMQQVNEGKTVTNERSFGFYYQKIDGNIRMFKIENIPDYVDFTVTTSELETDTWEIVDIQKNITSIDAVDYLVNGVSIFRKSEPHLKYRLDEKSNEVIMTNNRNGKKKLSNIQVNQILRYKDWQILDS